MSKLLFIPAVFLVTACATFPAQEMSDARQALQAAQAAEASRHAVIEYSEAQLLLRNADRFLNDGHYSLASKTARQAKALALEAHKKSVSYPK